MTATEPFMSHAPSPVTVPSSTATPWSPGTVSRWPATTTRCLRDPVVRATTLSPIRVTSSAGALRSVASTSSASARSSPLTEGMPT